VVVAVLGHPPLGHRAQPCRLVERAHSTTRSARRRPSARTTARRTPQNPY
jgi:hypothetical protein